MKELGTIFKKIRPGWLNLSGPVAESRPSIINSWDIRSRNIWKSLNLVMIFTRKELYELVRKYDGFKIRNIMTWIMYTTTPLCGDEYQQFYLVEGVKIEGTYLIITYDNLIDDVINCGHGSPEEIFRALLKHYKVSGEFAYNIQAKEITNHYPDFIRKDTIKTFITTAFKELNPYNDELITVDQFMIIII